MTQTDSTTAPGAGAFPITQWSVLLRLQDPSHPAFEAILNRLIEEYWKPVYHYLRSQRNVTAEDAKDLTQQFFTMLLSRRDFEKLSPDRGSFRGFLRTAARNFLVDADRARTARAPRDGAKLFRFGEAEQEWLAENSKAATVNPESAFDREWARDVLIRAAKKLKHLCSLEDKMAYFDIFRDYYLSPAGISDPDATIRTAATETPSYEDLSRRYRVDDHRVRHYLRYTRQRMKEILTDLVMEYVSPEQNIEDEIRFILSI